jgi:hypothetical protein
MTENEQLRSDPEFRTAYGELFDLYPDHPVTLDFGILRWVSNPMMLWIKFNVDLGDMHEAFMHGDFPLEDWARFNREIGASLSFYLADIGPYLKLSGVSSRRDIASALKGM